MKCDRPGPLTWSVVAAILATWFGLQAPESGWLNALAAGAFVAAWLSSEPPRGEGA